MRIHLGLGTKVWVISMASLIFLISIMQWMDFRDHNLKIKCNKETCFLQHCKPQY